MSDDVVNIEVDGKPVEARKGQMVIEVTDKIGLTMLAAAQSCLDQLTLE